MFRVCKNFNIYSSRISSIRSFGGSIRPNAHGSIEKSTLMQRLYNQIPRGFKKYFPEGKGGSNPKENPSGGAAKEKPAEGSKSEQQSGGNKEIPKEKSGAKQSESNQSSSSSNTGKARMAGAGKGNAPKIPNSAGGVGVAVGTVGILLALLLSSKKDGK